MSEISRAVMDEVYAALPIDGSAMTRAEIMDALGQWAPVTVKHALRQLREEGRVVRDGPHMHPAFRRAAHVAREAIAKSRIEKGA